MVKHLIPSVITRYHKYLTAASHLHASGYPDQRGSLNSPLLPHSTPFELEPASVALEVRGGVIRVVGGVFKMRR